MTKEDEKNIIDHNNKESTRDSVVFYLSFYEAIREFPPDIQNEIYNAIFRYSFFDEEIGMDGTAKALFTLIKPNIDAAIKRRDASIENGKLGGRPKKPKPNQNLPKTQQEPNRNLNVDVDTDVDENADADAEKEYKTLHQMYGIHQNVSLTADEIYSLKTDFPEDWKKRIESVSEWYHKKGIICINGAEQARKWTISPHQFKNENKENISNDKSPYSSLEPDILTDEEMNEIERLYNG